MILAVNDAPLKARVQVKGSIRLHDCPEHGTEYCYSQTCMHECNKDGKEASMTYVQVAERLKKGEEFV